MSIEDLQKLLKNKVILFIGAPLAGKGTQGTRLAQHLHRPYLSTGDLFRLEIASGSTYGREIEGFLNNGQLIPNELTTKFLTEKLNDRMYDDGMVLDGYPRNLSHVDLFEGMNENRKILLAIYLDVTKSILDQRRKQRDRNDDRSNIFEDRYRIFQEETVPLIDYLRSKDLLIHIRCDCQSMEEIHQIILKEIFEKSLLLK